MKVLIFNYVVYVKCQPNSSLCRALTFWGKIDCISLAPSSKGNGYGLPVTLPHLDLVFERDIGLLLMMMMMLSVYRYKVVRNIIIFKIAQDLQIVCQFLLCLVVTQIFRFWGLIDRNPLTLFFEGVQYGLSLPFLTQTLFSSEIPITKRYLVLS